MIFRDSNRKFALLSLTIIGLCFSYFIGYSVAIDTSKKELEKSTLKDFSNLDKLNTFLRENEVDKNRWIDGEYTCYTFSTDLVEAARTSGYRGQVIVKSNYMDTGLAHARVQFWVESIGLWVLVEPQNDGIIEVDTSYTKYGNWVG